MGVIAPFRVAQLYKFNIFKTRFKEVFQSIAHNTR